MKKILGLLAIALIATFIATPVFADGTAAPKPTDYPEESTITSTEEVLIEEANPEEATEPVMWPVYLSLGMLGAMILIFIILNLADRKK